MEDIFISGSKVADQKYFLTEDESRIQIFVNGYWQEGLSYDGMVTFDKWGITHRWSRKDENGALRVLWVGYLGDGGNI